MERNVAKWEVTKVLRILSNTTTVMWRDVQFAV